VNELASRLKGSSSLIVIDVRGPDEFAGPLGHIAGAKNLPVGELAPRLHELTACKDRSVVLVCQTEKRSLRPHCSAIQERWSWFLRPLDRSPKVEAGAVSCFC
jgi:rhodanese-related sulfurtransferase